MKIKKLTVLILSLCMVVSLSACAGVNENTGSTQHNTVAPSATESTPSELAVTLTIMPYGLESMSGVQTDDPIMKYVTEKTGVTLDFINTAGMNLTTEYNAMIASGSMPDIVSQQWGEQTKLLLDNDAIIPLDDLVAARGGEITDKKMGAFALDYSHKYMSKDDGKLYFIPLKSGLNYSAGYPSTGAYIRWDIYNKIGNPQVKDLYGLLDVLKQMQDAYPETEDGKKVYAISGFLADQAWNTFSLTAAECFIGFRKLDSYGYLGTYIYDRDTLFNAMETADSPTWELFRFYNKAYQMGILDPETVTMKFDQWSEKLMAGQVLYSPLYLGPISIMDDPNKTLLPVKFEQFYNDSFTCLYGGIGYGYAITTACEYPERAMDFLNFCWSYDGAYALANGVKGDTWTEVDGVKRLTPEYVAALADGSRTGSRFEPLAGPEMDETTNTPINLDNTADYFATYKREGITKDYCDFYGVNSPIEVFLEAKYTTWQFSNNDPGGTYDDELSALNASIQDYALTNLPRLVIAKNDEEFETIRHEIYSTIDGMGAERLLEFKQQNYADEGKWLAENWPTFN